MQLCYRGIPYRKTSTSIPTTEYETVGNYRGKPWRKRVLKDSLSIQGFRQLKYRGISYISPVWGLKPTHSPFNPNPKRWLQRNASVPSLLQRFQFAIAKERL